MVSGHSFVLSLSLSKKCKQRDKKGGGVFFFLRWALEYVVWLSCIGVLLFFVEGEVPVKKNKKKLSECLSREP